MDRLEQKIDKTDFAKVLKAKGYAYFTNGDCNLNIIGIRRAGNRVTNYFDDFIIVEYYIDGTKCREVFDATTDPGITSMKNPLSRKGCAILVPGQYRGAYQIGLHKGKYEALCQRKPLKVYRDGNKDNVYDFDTKTIEEGLFGINIHKAGDSSTIVNGWSAGCQVLARANDFKTLMKLAHKQIANGMGKTFTYTLLNEEDLG